LIVVDTSAWVEYLRGTGSAAGVSVRTAVAAEQRLLVPDVVRLELLAGAAEPSVDELRRFLARFEPLPTTGPADHDLAASLYRRVRATGRTVRSLVDCLVAAAALRLDAAVLAQDRDFAVLAEVSDLRLA